MKKIVRSFFLCFLVVGSFFLTDKAVAAEKVILAPNTEVEGRVSEEAKTVSYEMTVDKTGYQNFVFEVGEGDSELIKSGWTLRLFDENNVKFYDKDYIKQETKIGVFHFAKGAKLKAEVTFSSEYGIPELSYKVEFITEEAKDYEVENNDTLSKANVLKNKKEVIGNSFHGKDTDFYVYTIPENGITTVKFKILDFNSELVNLGWDVEILDSDKKQIFEYERMKNDFSSYEITFKKGTKIYVSVMPHSDYGPFLPHFVDYELKVETEKTSSWEREENNSFKKATPLGKGKKGYILNMEDVDFYTLKANKTKKYQLSFEAEEPDAYSHKISVYVGKKGNEVVSETFNADGRLSFKVKKGQRIWIKVQRYAYNHSAKNEYELKVK